MGEAKGVESGYPRDLLNRFTSSSSPLNLNYQQEVKIEEEAEEEIELNLGLSLGGRFGVDPKESNKLVRSTSIAGLTTLFRDNDVGGGISGIGVGGVGVPQQVVNSSIFRTTSLPTETEEEWRKRKEMQCLRRMEAKRKRSEKQKNNNRGGGGGVRSDRASVEEDKRVDGLLLPIPSFMGNSAAAAQKQSDGVSLPLGLPPWGKGGGGSVGGSPNGKAANVAVSSPAPAPAPAPGPGGQPGFPPSSQGSMGSQGSSSTSGISEFDSPTIQPQGLSNSVEARSPVNDQSLPEQNEQKPNISLTSTVNVDTGMPTSVEMENTAKKPRVMENGARETGMKVMEEMPCVSTKGDGPNGRKIEGFLYKYKKGEEVRIVCVCHGNFLSPAEFVKHAGGGDVAHPLRHIVVNPSPSFS